MREISWLMLIFCLLVAGDSGLPPSEASEEPRGAGAGSPLLRKAAESFQGMAATTAQWHCEDSVLKGRQNTLCYGTGNTTMVRYAEPTRSLIAELGFVGLPLSPSVARSSSPDFFEYQFSMSCSFDGCFDPNSSSCVVTQDPTTVTLFTSVPTTLFYLQDQTGDPDCVHSFLSCQSASCILSLDITANCLNCPIYMDLRWY